MTTLAESELVVPADMVRRCKGFCFDFGSSAIKCIYRTKEEFDEVASKDAKFGRLQLVTFARGDMEAGLKYVRQRAYQHHNTDADEQLMVTATGVGCQQFGKPLSTILNMGLQTRVEFDCFVESFVYLVARMPRRLLLEPFVDDAMTDAIDYITGYCRLMLTAATDKKSKHKELNIDGVLAHPERATGRPPADVESCRTDVDHEQVQVPVAEAEPNTFPCLLAVGGSCFVAFRIEEDGSYISADWNSGYGKMLIGVGSLLTGVKTFEEFIELASSGDSRNVDESWHDLLSSTEMVDNDNSCWYKDADKVTSFVIFSFGKTVGANPVDFRREDLARSWLEYVVQDYVRAVHLACSPTGIKRVFFCAGFSANPLVRRLVMAEMARKNLYRMLTAKAEPIMFDFIKPGQHLGALGCIVYDVENSTAESASTQQ